MEINAVLVLGSNAAMLVGAVIALYKLDKNKKYK